MNLVLLNLKVSFLNLYDYLRTVIHFYPNINFAKADIALLSLYFFDNPFSISKRFHRLREDPEVYVYGETPIITLNKIAKEAQIKDTDTVYELGAGRGRAAFWFNRVIGCNTVAIEEIPDFVSRANQVIRKQNIQNLKFIHDDFIDADLSKGNVFYLYGIFLDDIAITKLANKLKDGDTVISVSYPLSDYSDKFRLVKHFPAKFTWGWGDVYIQTKDKI